ncbi:GNAT family N-acetyltransferase [Microlunatus capsulatus]|uniref:RimJ/RimL family protein N-acetyltransferase n=1 Tax=Microlunatus capsulatus TaxID=99117 RepID=A0ABS4Z2V7_9ACTN|nr:GNAT family N-acetyltransferase [Microlunatus capsulatus]MBP2415383.1 RimJ/RimL family protein N-acetyltransferase [Microlunatus capsulatus]
MPPEVLLRPVVLADWPAIHHWAADEQACRFQAWGPNTPEQTRTFTSAAVAAWSRVPQDRHVWVAELGRQVVGLGELTIRSRRDQHGEIAYAVDVDHWRRGIATAVAVELLRRAFVEHGLHRVSATCDPRNTASARVLQKIGMTYEGRLRDTIRLRDGWRDSEVRSVLASEWAVSPHAP